MDEESAGTGRVLVVGAGPVGLVAACELARQGVRPRLIDTRAEPSLLSRAVMVHARSQEMLASLGALDGIEARSRRIVAVQALSAGRTAPLIRIEMADLPTRYPCGLDLPQSETEAVLSERAAELGVSVERGVQLTGLAPTAGGSGSGPVEVSLQGAAGPERASFDWVVGADGAHSAVRAAVGSALAGRFVGQHFVLADVDADTDLDRDSVTMFPDADGLGALFPMAGDRVRLMFAVDAPPPGAPEPSLDAVQRLVDARMGGRLRLRAGHWLTYFEVHHGQVPHYRYGRVLLAGDAAHIHSPAAGQGMNTGMQDAANLAWKLALVSGGRARESLLDSYEAERHPVAAEVIKLTTTLTDAMTASGWAGTARGWAVAAAGHLHGVKEAAAEWVSEVTIGYPSSPIVGGTARRRPLSRALRPGDHAPDVDGLRHPDGSPVWLGELLRQPGHLVFVRTPDDRVVESLQRELGSLGTVLRVVGDAADASGGATAGTEPPAGRLVDPGGAFARAYGTGDDGLAVIRPDGYVGYLATPADSGALGDYLRHHLGAVAEVVSAGR